MYRHWYCVTHKCMCGWNKSELKQYARYNSKNVPRRLITMVQLFLNNFVLLLFVTFCTNSQFMVMHVEGRERKPTPGLLSSPITTHSRTDRGKPLNASVKLVFAWERELGAFLKNLPTHLRVFFLAKQNSVLQILATESHHFIVRHQKRVCFIKPVCT